MTSGSKVFCRIDQVDQRRAEQKKFGIEFDDEYDYLQHLRDPCAPPERYAVEVNDIEEEEDDDEEDDDDDQTEEDVS